MNCIISAECIVQFEDNVVVSCIPLSEILSNTLLAATKHEATAHFEKPIDQESCISFMTPMDYATTPNNKTCARFDATGR